MALIKCPECETEISEKAEVCPNCGYRIKNKKNKNLKFIILIIFILFLVMISQLIKNNSVDIGTTENETIQKNDFVGEWDLVGVTSDGDIVITPDQLKDRGYSLEGNLRIDQDNTFKLTLGSADDSGDISFYESESTSDLYILSGEETYFLSFNESDINTLYLGVSLPEEDHSSNLLMFVFERH